MKRSHCMSDRGGSVDFGIRSKRNLTERNPFEDALEPIEFFDSMYAPQSIVQESDELIDLKIRHIESEIDHLSDNLKEAYCLAVAEEIKQETDYVRSKKLLLAFLRADGFDAQKAALRLATFFHTKLDLFGQEMLPRTIRQDDLSHNDKLVLNSGYVHFCADDCGGRLVALINRRSLVEKGLLNEHFAKNISRACFYQTMYQVENRGETFRNGVVIVRWNLNCSLPLKDFRILFHAFIKMFKGALPVKFAAIHSCCSTAVERFTVSWVDSIMQRDTRHMSRVHGPSPAACLAELSKYGIDVDSFPINNAGMFNDAMHEKQLERWRQKENELSTMLTEFSQLSDIFIDSNCCSDKDDDVDFELIPSLAQDPLGEGQVETPLKGYDNDSYDRSITPPLEVETDMATRDTEALLVKQPLLPSKPSKFSSTPSKDFTSELPAEEHLPSKLMGLLQENQTPEALWWSRGGTAFTFDKEKFQQVVLPTEFKGVKLDSFLRRLHRWGFQRVPNSEKASLSKCEGNAGQTPSLVYEPNCLEYEHHLFQKSSPELLNDWNNLSIKVKFPIRLRSVLDRTTEADGIWWVCDGKAFAIEKDRLSCDVLEKNFNGLKLASFHRLLRRWGFKQLPTDKNVEALGCDDIDSEAALIFHHPMFQKDSRLTAKVLDEWTQAKAASTKPRNIKGENFPKKMYRILHTVTAQDGIWWVNSGVSFAINTPIFSQHVLPEQYNGIKFKSFQRSLRRWGFERIETNDEAVTIFRHPSFQKDMPQLLNSWPKPGSGETTSAKQ